MCKNYFHITLFYQKPQQYWGINKDSEKEPTYLIVPDQVINIPKLSSLKPKTNQKHHKTTPSQTTTTKLKFLAEDKDKDKRCLESYRYFSKPKHIRSCKYVVLLSYIYKNFLKI
jgi:hypothetical protein|tara:strand:+ start:3316 stop:3657 length:342 start_codon:yes stop_codon:yes gene_type:complete